MLLFNSHVNFQIFLYFLCHCFDLSFAVKKSKIGMVDNLQIFIYVLAFLHSILLFKL